MDIALSHPSVISSVRHSLRRGDLPNAQRQTMAAYDNGEDSNRLLRNVLDFMRHGTEAAHRHLPGHDVKVWPVTEHGEVLIDASICAIRRGFDASVIKSMLHEADNYFTAAEEEVGREAVRFVHVLLLITEGKQAEAEQLQHEMAESWTNHRDSNARLWNNAIQIHAKALQRRQRLPRWLRWMVR